MISLYMYYKFVSLSYTCSVLYSTVKIAENECYIKILDDTGHKDFMIKS